jgi:hypothetical protein
MKPELLLQLPRAIFRVLQRFFSNTLTLKDETFLFLGLVVVWLVGASKMAALLGETLLIVQNALPHLALDPLSTPMLVGLMACSGLMGLFIGGVSVTLWFTGRDLRRRGGLGGTPPAANLPATLPE